MAVVTKVICDVCAAEKGSENHWWIVFISNSETQPVLRILPLDEAQICAKDFVACGEACALKKVSEWMGANKK
jgi:hypothetical protein